MNCPDRFIEANERVGEPDLIRSGGAQLSGFRLQRTCTAAAACPSACAVDHARRSPRSRLRGFHSGRRYPALIVRTMQQLTSDGCDVVGGSMGFSWFGIGYSDFDPEREVGLENRNEL